MRIKVQKQNKNVRLIRDLTVQEPGNVPRGALKLMAALSIIKYIFNTNKNKYSVSAW